MAFITKIAEYIKAHYNLKKETLTVIFPNKRAAFKLRKELSKNNKENIWLPHILSIQEAMSDWSGIQLIDNVDITFELIKILNNSDNITLRYDNFGIASQMLKDFDEIDQYAVDAKGIFNYLNEVKKLENWTPDLTNKTETEYLNFFSSLYVYYNSLREILLHNKVGYYGLICRELYNLSKEELESIIGDRKIIFAGFNAMTRTEEEIIVRLVRTGNARLIWDLDKYYFEDVKQEAGLFARDFFARHPDMEKTLINDNLSKDKNINIISVSGNHVQANAMQLKLNKESRDSELDKEVIVLSDETMLIPVLNSLPTFCKEVGVTMGFPFSKTIIYQFISSLFEFQKSIGDDNKVYFWSLIKLINQDFFKSLFDKTDLKYLFKWKDELIGKSIYYINYEDYIIFNERDNLYQMLLLISKKWRSTLECISFFKDLLKYVYKLIEDKDDTYFIKNQISVAGKIFNKIEHLFEKYSILIQITDIESLFLQASLEMNIALNGSSNGLQIMGLLETRNLDFDVVHILSVNEGVLPQAKNTNSLIPFDLRIEYKLPIYKNKQAIYAYHFYRLIQNAKTINIYYNTVSDGMGEGEPSRFILQLLNELPCKSKNINIMVEAYKPPTIEINNTIPIRVEKSKDILNKIKHKLTSDSGMSPTSISSYLNCQLQFYLRYIEKVNDNSNEELIQSNIIGSIIHDTFQILYENFKDDTIDLESYNNILETEFNKSFQEALNKNNFPNGLPESGFNYLSKEMINMMINNFIKYEQAFLKDNSFKILGLETLYDDYFDIDGIKVHLTGRIDRIDQVGDMIRILDYKTGSINSSDVTINKNIDTLSALSPKALQLIIYKYLYSKKHKDIEITNISPGIFGLMKLSKGVFSLKNNAEEFADDKFIDRCEFHFESLFGEILDKDTPFVQTGTLKNCNYCEFINICKRQPTSY